VTTDIGPRIIRFGTVGGQNLFKEYKNQLGKMSGQNWNILGGHRLGHAPEANPRTYYPDNELLVHNWDGRTLKLIQNIEPTTGIGKEIEITLDKMGNHVKVVHRLINHTTWPIEAAVWCLSVIGRPIVPNEPYHSHYTNMADKRWIWGTKYVQLRQDPNADTSQKIGVFNAQGWAAYYLNKQLFVKQFGWAAPAVRRPMAEQPAKPILQDSVPIYGRREKWSGELRPATIWPH
jgi:hypothetical protein